MCFISWIDHRKILVWQHSSTFWSLIRRRREETMIAFKATSETGKQPALTTSYTSFKQKLNPLKSWKYLYLDNIRHQKPSWTSSSIMQTECRNRNTEQAALGQIGCAKPERLLAHSTESAHLFLFTETFNWLWIQWLLSFFIAKKQLKVEYF